MSSPVPSATGPGTNLSLNADDVVALAQEKAEAVHRAETIVELCQLSESPTRIIAAIRHAKTIRPATAIRAFHALSVNPNFDAKPKEYRKVMQEIIHHLPIQDDLK